jgi:uncharacterized protein YciW
MSTSTTTADVVNAILGIDDTSPIAALRNQKPEQVAQLQHYYETLFQPAPYSAADLPVSVRALVAVRVASHTHSAAVVAWYERVAADSGATDEQIARARDLSTPWTDDDVLGAAIRRADRVAVDPASTEREQIVDLEAAGLTPTAIVALSQVIAFVAYQLRFVSILRALGGAA